MSSDRKLDGRTILVGVTGSIAAYKAPMLVRLLKRQGAVVQVLGTPAAARFVTPETLATLSERPVLTDMFAGHDTWTQHVELGLNADLLVIAPLSAQTLAKLAHGFADSMLTATALAARCPVLLCPAMDHFMYQNAAVRANLKRVKQYAYHVMPPEWGELASGLSGVGRMPEPDQILRKIEQLLLTPAPLHGKHALVTAGPTREPIDAIRVVTNHSTGTMGYALAEALASRGAQVTLISGPTLLATPANVRRIDVETAAQMHAAVQPHAAADLVFMAAAVADYAPSHPVNTKLKKQAAARSLQLEPTTDILKGLGERKRPGQVLVGFAMETHDGSAHARKKLQTKNLDWIVLNYVNEEGAGFGTGTNRVTLLGRNGFEKSFPTMPKHDVAEALLQHILYSC